MTFPNLSLKAHQQGAATLLVVMVLAIVMAIISFTTANTGLMEQKIVGNDLRAREAFEGADAGIEYGVAYLTNDNYKALTWSTSGNNQSSSPATASGNIASGDFSYTPNVTYQRVLNSNYVRIVSTSSETHDNTISATNEQYVKALTLLNGGSAFNAPPLTMDGCLSDTVGGPDIYIGTRPDGIAAGTSHSPANQGAWGDSGDTDNPCLKQGNLKAHGGQPVGNLFTPGKAWEYIFGTVTRAQIKAKADAEAAAGIAAINRNYVWVTDSGNYHTSWGSATHPIILVFAASANCPKINGNPTIYGVVFIDAPCTANGWGGTDVYGTVIINGNTSNLNANTTIRDWSAASGTTTGLGNSFIDGIYKIPGTWKDF
jgi:Tfp pilus assembly protein PilX